MLGGLAPVIIFNFYRSINTPKFLSGFVSSPKLPLVPIPIYLDEKLTGIQLDDYNRTTSVEVMIDGNESFEKISGDIVQLKFRAKRDNIVLTAISALIERILRLIENQDYSLTVFYDNIFIINASLEQFQTNLVEGTDLREIVLTVSNRPPKKAETTTVPIQNTVGTAAGINI